MFQVYLHNGAVHVIPRQKDAKAIKIPDKIESAHLGAKIVFDHPELTVADSSIQLCIEKKIGSVVDDMEKNLFHNANCYIPAKLAFVLQKFPTYVSPAVQAFYFRLPEDLKVDYYLNFVMFFATTNCF